jgi:hypothetical protein
MGRDDKELLKEVNGSGFPLQLGVERLVRQKPGKWIVKYSEHHYRNARTTNQGYLDLVLEDQQRATSLVLECKRVRDADWIFLRERAHTNDVVRAKGYVQLGKASKHCVGWQDVDAILSSAECEFCVVAGEGNKPRYMLENLCAQVAESTEALAEEDLRHGFADPERMHLYFGVIVTTANLWLSEYEPASINLTSGELATDTKTSQAEFVRFRKQVGAARPTRMRSPGHEGLATSKESTLFVVNVNWLEKFLGYFEVRENSVRELLFNPPS